MLITHLALTVRDPERSRAFYVELLGIDGTARAEPWGVRVDLGNGFMLALIRGEPLAADVSPAVHFGCALRDAATARELRARLQSADVREIEWEDTDEYVGVKIADPDGYVVELAYESVTAN